MNISTAFWKDKKVLVTGHTGFKGSWLTLWLNMLGAKVVGLSEKSLGKNSLYISAELQSLTENKSYELSEFNNILDVNSLVTVIERFQPEIVFHLAAQPLVISSYKLPSLTYHTNVVGTLNILETSQLSKSLKVIISVTTDKVYHNTNQASGYVENDKLGGLDPYSASKACADMLTQSHYASFMKNLGVGVAPVRAGNVIGGGDWSENRLVPDIFRSVQNGDVLKLRHPQATRPWQHVLEPLSGYMLLAERLYNEPERFSVPFNFGPTLTDVLSVEQVVEIFSKGLDRPLAVEYEHGTPFHEADKLSLDCDFAKAVLGWVPRWDANRAIARTLDWYKKFLLDGDIKDITIKQILDYSEDHQKI